MPQTRFSAPLMPRDPSIVNTGAVTPLMVTSPLIDRAALLVTLLLLSSVRPRVNTDPVFSVVVLLIVDSNPVPVKLLAAVKLCVPPPRLSYVAILKTPVCVPPPFN